jgi:KEOPS complex subunit Pcc1
VGDLSNRASALISIHFDSKKDIFISNIALKPETICSNTSRSKVTITQKGKKIQLFFESSDTTSLRASINSYMSWIRLLKEITHFLK